MDAIRVPLAPLRRLEVALQLNVPPAQLASGQLWGTKADVKPVLPVPILFQEQELHLLV